MPIVHPNDAAAIREIADAPPYSARTPLPLPMLVVPLSENPDAGRGRSTDH